MKRLLVALIVGTMLLPLSVFAQDQEQISIYAYSYFTPPEAVGTVTTVVGLLEPPVGFTYPFSVDFDANEYTFYYQTTITAIVPGPVMTDIYYADADIYIYEDPSMNADYGVNPPNGTAPSTFQDGTLILQGTYSSFVRSDDNMGFFNPTFISDCTFTGGSKFDELLQGPNWTMHGGINLLDFATPTGYQHSWNMKIFFTGPVSVEQSSWGGIKAILASE